jgi:hypothetical protein
VAVTVAVALAAVSTVDLRVAALDAAVMVGPATMVDVIHMVMATAGAAAAVIPMALTATRIDESISPTNGKGALRSAFFVVVRGLTLRAGEGETSQESQPLRREARQKHLKRLKLLSPRLTQEKSVTLA